jgi:uncharacterized protein YkwD
MRSLAALGALTVLFLAFAPEGSALSRKPARLLVAGHVRNMQSPLQRVTMPLLRNAALAHKAARPHRTSRPTALLSALELNIVDRMNAQRGARGLRPLRVSRGLAAAAKYHCRQMGLFGFFEHESHNGAPFWRRIQRFYPPRHGYWSVGENILWASPDTSASGAVRDWMASPPHRQNILTGEYREVGVAAVHFGSAPGAFGGRPVTIVTADFGIRR